MAPISYAQKMKPPKPTRAELAPEVKPKGWEEEPTPIELKKKELEELKAKETAEAAPIAPSPLRAGVVRPSTVAPIPEQKLTKAETVEAKKLAELSTLPSDIPVPPAKPVIVTRRSRPKSF